MEYLKRVAGHRTVPVEYGKHYGLNWNQTHSSQDFLRDHIYAAAPEKAYLAQHRLFDQIPELAKDIMTPDYCVLVENENDDDVEINARFGPGGTSQIHDPKHNLAQVVGQSTFVCTSRNTVQDCILTMVSCPIRSSRGCGECS